MLRNVRCSARLSVINNYLQSQKNINKSRNLQTIIQKAETSCKKTGNYLKKSFKVSFFNALIFFTEEDLFT